MPQNKFLIYCSLLTCSAYQSLREIAQLSSVVDTTQLDAMINEAAFARLDFAAQMLAFVDTISQAALSDPIAARTLVSRCYYIAHHALRALLLFVERGDEEVHQGVIERAYRLVASDGLLSARLGPAKTLRDDMKELMAQRHLGDYYPFGTATPQEPPLDFVASAQQARQLADKIVQQVSRTMMERNVTP